MSLGGIVGTLLYGILSSYIGSKRSMLLCALPLAVSVRFIVSVMSFKIMFLIAD